MQQKAFNLRFILAASITMLALAITVVVSYTIGRTGIERLERSIGMSLATIADQMQEKLDRGLFERVREINNVASLLAVAPSETVPGPAIRQWLETIQSSLPDYVWIGITDANGRVLSATRGMLEGTNVAGNAWFRAGLKGAVFGDIQGAGPVVDRDMPKAEGQTARLIAVAAPINVDGKIRGVVGAQLSWNWAKDVQDSLFGSMGGRNNVEVLVIGEDSRVILGPPETVGRQLHVGEGTGTSLAAGPRRFAVDTWPDGTGYLSGFAEDVDYPLFSGLGWRILVRQNAEQALAPVMILRQQIITWSAVFVGLSAWLAWWLAGRLSAPLLRLTAAANRLSRGEPAVIPIVDAYAEAEILSNSLRSLVDELQHREHHLSDLNASLESQVADRTRKLEKRNLQLAQAKERAEEATQAKSRFLAAASHDLRQPLHAMTLFVRALSRRVDNSEARQLVGQTEQSLASLKEMFDALLNVSRLDAGLIEPNEQEINLRDFVERVSAGFKAEAEHRGLRFRARTVDAVVRTDPALLETIVRNLLSNALKFTKRGGVMLACRRKGGRIAFEIADTGLGIAAETGASVFREFQRSKQSAVGANDGLGLGLSIVKRYAELLRMDVRFRSKPGRGTRFIVLLPAGSEVLAGHSIASVEPQPFNLVGRRLFVLDDEPLIVESLARDLEDRGNDVMRAGSVAEAEAQLRACSPSDLPEAYVVDIHLGEGETGPQFLDRMEQLAGRQLPALILTGATDASTLGELTQGRRRWMTKPADPDAIARALAEVAGPVPADQTRRLRHSGGARLFGPRGTRNVRPQSTKLESAS